VAEQADAFARIEIAIDMVDRDDSAEVLDDLAHLDERRAVCWRRGRGRGWFRLNHGQVLFW
jgi:hypothetical protein